MKQRSDWRHTPKTFRVVACYNAQSVIISEGVRRQLTFVSVKCVPLDTSGIQLWEKSPSPTFKSTHASIR